MKLQQNQVWQVGEMYVRIVQLERMRVKYKTMVSLSAREGTHQDVTKKQFCRMLKGARLVEPVAEANRVVPHTDPC